ncbi:MAG: EAL domain-containing protein [Pseudomonadota bacterium]
MTRTFFTFLALLVCSGVSVQAAHLAVPADPPFRTYSVRDGLNQKAVTAIAQDLSGMLWIATFGGLNRFDGKTFDSVTTANGLRQNLIQALMVDRQNRVWAGDGEGGLSVIENGVVTQTFEPTGDTAGTVREIVEVGDYLYFTMQPGGLRRLALNDPAAVIEPVAGSPSSLTSVADAGEGRLLVVDDNFDLHLLKPESLDVPVMLASDIVIAKGNGAGRVYVTHQDGRIGEVVGKDISWFEGRYPGRVTGLTFNDEQLEWVFVDRQGVSRFGAPGVEDLIRVNWSVPGFVDADGVLWLATRAGLARYFGKRFAHYSLAINGESPGVFAVEKAGDQDVWFGTGFGLLHVTPAGELVNVTDQLGHARREVRAIVPADDGRKLYFIYVTGGMYRLDTQTLEAEQLLGEGNPVLVSLTADPSGVLWAGSYYGELFRYDPVDDSVQTLSVGEGAALYGVDVDAAGRMWLAANFNGVYSLDTTASEFEITKHFDVAELGKTFFTHLVVDERDGEETVWLASLDGGLFQIRDSGVTQVIDPAVINDRTIFGVGPLVDGTVVLSTSRGVYKLDPSTGEMDYFSDMDGFVALEGKVRALYPDENDLVWIGTTEGVSVMDASLPRVEVGAPRPVILQRTVDRTVLGTGIEEPEVRHDSRFLVKFGAVSTLRPDSVDFSYRLDGRDDHWSAPTRTRSIEFSGLRAGDYTFEVRARFPAGDWSDAQSWAFTVPAPVYRQTWFVLCASLFAAMFAWSLIQLRLRAIERSNKRLRLEVVERTRSIEEQRHELETINEQLSSEIEEREKADAKRAEIEARFHQAYQNSPVGMALVDIEAHVYDANPALKQLFWPEASAKDRAPLADVVVEKDRSAFTHYLSGFADGNDPDFSMEVDCTDANGQIRRMEFAPSAVRNPDGELQYIVLIANDVTERRAMTRQLEYQARYDELTGLVNRRAFAEHLAEIAGSARAQGSYLMFLDLDQFKVVNDTCGHAAGDELLRNVSRLIEASVRDQDIVARLGGDEFGLILTSCTEAAALRRAEAIRQSVADLEFLWESDVFRIGVSIGIVPITNAMQDLNELQQVADAACYAAKDAGRNRVHLVSGRSDTVYEQRGEMRWVQRLNHAIDNDSFVLFGQKIVPTDPDANEPHRIEVLLRMKDRSSDRLIPPGAFLPAAERYGLQGRLDQWVVNSVITMLTNASIDPDRAPRLWLNLSGASVGDAKFSRNLIERVSIADLPAGTLNFEITETAVIRKIEEATQLIAALREMGCQFSLDDFGSGLSSFGYLKQLNVDGLKIDGQFIRDIADDPTDRIFVKSIIDIAHTLRLRVVAEFVEDDRTLNLIRTLGCDYAQGFGVHRPVPLADLLLPDMTAIDRTA